MGATIQPVSDLDATSWAQPELRRAFNEQRHKCRQKGHREEPHGVEKEQETDAEKEGICTIGTSGAGTVG